MRRRNPHLRTGSLIAWFDENDRSRNASILFMVTGARDIETLAAVERACRNEARLPLAVHAVADQLELGAADPRLDPETMLRVEVAEFADLGEDDLRKVLSPTLRVLERGERPAFPDAALAVGGVAEGVQFLNRDEDLDVLRRLVLEEGRSASLVAPRRTGKTSLLRRFKDRFGGEARIELLDLERYGSPRGAAAGIWASILQATSAEARREVERLGWKDAARHAIEKLASNRGLSAVLLLDELVFFLENVAASGPEGRGTAIEFLAVLGTAAGDAHVPILTASSRDLSEYAVELERRPEDLPAPFNDLARHVLLPPADSVLRIELRRVLVGTGLVPEPGDLDWLARNVDLAMPYPAMRFLSELASRLRTDGPIDAGGLDQHLDQFLDATDAFREIESRIREVRRQERGGRDRIATALARVVRGHESGAAPVAADIISDLGGDDAKKGEKLLAWMLDTLPVRSEAGRILCASCLFRRWWMKREGTEE
jgi:hypothetical protein